MRLLVIAGQRRRLGEFRPLLSSRSLLILGARANIIIDGDRAASFKSAQGPAIIVSVISQRSQLGSSVYLHKAHKEFTTCKEGRQPCLKLFFYQN